VSSLPTCYRHPGRETGVTCSECGRPICTDCMVFAPVGIRCPEHAGQARRLPASRTAKRLSVASGEGLVTKSLIAVNVGIYFLQLAEGAPLNANSGWIFNHGALVASGAYPDGQPAGVAHGEWWRLITAAFLHYGPLHLAMNMLVLWFVGGPIEYALGRWRYLGVYLVSGLAGSAGALLVSPTSVTVGASGAIFGLFGALLVLEYEHTGRLVGGPAFTLIALNLVLTFAIPNVSWGGHVGGLVGGALGTLALSHFRRRSPAYQAADALGAAGLVAVGILSVAVAYWKVHSLGLPV
jgi:membrane associated rhomboid family serine protease